MDETAYTMASLMSAAMERRKDAMQAYRPTHEHKWRWSDSPFGFACDVEGCPIGIIFPTQIVDYLNENYATYGVEWEPTGETILEAFGRVLAPNLE